MPAKAATDLLPTLSKYFGYTSFRPLQEEIIQHTLAGRDVFALLPTGGGKSLCYQLPALLLPGLTVVVSPLIALMKDQVDGMIANGVPATFLNSTLDGAESFRRQRTIEAGKCKLLYVAPERLMLADFLEQLKRWNVSLFAIDEAHCISEWGHDFRPEYRQLSRLRALFPGTPFAVFTATATQRVREDIIAQLKLRDATPFVASFNRPNLRYKILAKKDPEAQVLSLLRGRPNDSGIVYCQARKTTESLSEFLRENGLKARAYHAGLQPEERSAVQEQFRRDDVQVICATIAFGMGVNKPNVRFVVHYDLPKNIESFYQETGRAGRDGLPSDCVLLFNAGDIVKQMRFIDQMENEKEAQNARQQLFKMSDFAQSNGCRRVPLLKYFGEDYTGGNCQACDECLTPREEYDGTLLAQKFMSCIVRIKQQSPSFGAGARYVADVLRGELTDLIRGWNHEALTTFGIGKELSQKEWLDVARELARLGYTREFQDGKYSRVEITNEGRRVLTERIAIQFRRARAEAEPETRRSRKGSKSKSAQGEIECDEALFDRLRALRRKLADERSVPAYVVFSDATLRLMARDYPQTSDAFARINGVGEKKRQEFADAFTSEIVAFLRDNPKQTFSVVVADVDDSAAPIKRKLNATARETFKLYKEGLSVAKMAERRGLTEGTIWEHLFSAAETGQTLELDRFVTREQQAEIVGALVSVNTGRMKDVFEKLGGKYSYGLLKLVSRSTSSRNEAE